VEELMEELASEMQLPERPILDEPTMGRLMDYSWPGNVRELRNILERALMLWESGPFRVPPHGDSPEAREWSHMVRFPRGRSMTDVAQEVKESLVREALRRTRGNRSHAARMLGITRYSLLRVLKSSGSIAQ
jgi:DNA-binding NtrC family response regulator